MPTTSSTSSSTQIRTQDLYDRGYFHGLTSGYPSEGYAEAHPDWRAWIELIGEFQPDGLLLELGCAYGYLTEAVRLTGRESFGLDISTYALSQHPAARSFLLQGDAQELPFANDCARVVTLFDLLEHLPDPRSCLRETVRTLAPNGLIAGATPDPLHFARHEKTHCFERPPSYWISALEELDLSVIYRFSVSAYNFQFLAAFKNSPMGEKIAAFHHDYLGSNEDFVSVSGPLEAVPRWGWSLLREQTRTLQETPAAVYLLNRMDGPALIRARFTLSPSPHFSTLRVRMDSSVLAEIDLNSERKETQVELPPFMVSSGGHHLIFELTPSGTQVRIGNLSLNADSCSRENLTLSLPFDLYQRYRLAGQVGELVSPRRILDIGGLLGDQDGHLATTADFFFPSVPDKKIQVTTTDLRHCDHPNHIPALAWKQPFGDKSFDLVLTLDVLEHLTKDHRADLLNELDRISRAFILIGAPFSSPEIERVEEELSKGLMDTSHFLEEHRTLGLPDYSLVEKHFQNRSGYQLYRFASGYLPRWRAMQILTQYYFQLNDYATMSAFNRLYNETQYPLDLAEPAYRSLFLISKIPLSENQKQSLDSLAAARVSDQNGPCSLSDIATNPGFMSLHQRLKILRQEQEKAHSDIQFLVNERQKLIHLLQLEVQHLQKELNDTPLWKLARRRFRDRRRLD